MVREGTNLKPLIPAGERVKVGYIVSGSGTVTEAALKNTEARYESVIIVGSTPDCRALELERLYGSSTGVRAQILNRNEHYRAFDALLPDGNPDSRREDAREAYDRGVA